VSSPIANAALILAFLLVGAFFAAAEIALVSLREGQVKSLATRGRRGAKVAALAADPNRFLAAGQIGVTTAGFLSAAFGAKAFADDLAPILEDHGFSPDAAYWVSFIGVTLVLWEKLIIGHVPWLAAARRREVARAAPDCLAQGSRRRRRCRRRRRRA